MTDAGTYMPTLPTYPKCDVLRTCWFFVPTTPRPKGSDNWAADKRTGKTFQVPTKSHKMGVGFQNLVTAEAWKAWRSPPTANPFRVTCVYLFKRPDSHYLPANSKRKFRVLKRSSPTIYRAKPDICKLDRRIHDALTDVVYIDDRLVVAKGPQWKLYGNVSGVWITVEELTEVL